MSIESVLRLHGHDCERSVLPDGRIHFDFTGGLPVGTKVMPLRGHTFHGGVAPEPEAAGLRKWWLQDDLMCRDVDEMRAFFPSFAMVDRGDEYPPAWCGEVHAGTYTFKIGIFHRVDRSLPRVVPITPKRRGIQVGRRFVRSPHLYLNGDICVADTGDWDPSEHSIATVVGWAAHWHAMYAEWLFTRRWACEGYRPNEVA